MPGPCASHCGRNVAAFQVHAGLFLITASYPGSGVVSHVHGPVGAPAWERVVTDIAAAVTDILVFHLGIDKARLTDDARLAEDLGADSLDVVEIVMSCEERFAIDIPNHVATRLATVGDAVRFIEAEMAGATGRDSAPFEPPPMMVKSESRRRAGSRAASDNLARGDRTKLL